MAQGLNGNAIAASTPCCPVCWELFKIFEQSGAGFAIPSCHRTVCPMELPGWLPEDILKALLLRIRELLIVEIDCMIQQHHCQEHICTLMRTPSPEPLFNNPSTSIGRHLINFRFPHSSIEAGGSSEPNSQPVKCLPPVNVLCSLLSAIRACFARP
jgi:hypothetical protein